MRISSQTLIRHSRSTVRSPHAMDRTSSVAARSIRDDSRKDRCLAPNTSQERSCATRRQRVVRACAQVHGGPAKAAHQKPRPSQTSGGPAPYAIEDPAPLQNERVRKRGDGDLGPDTPAGQKITTTAVSRALVPGERARGLRFQAHRSLWYQSRSLTPLQLVRAT